MWRSWIAANASVTVRRSPCSSSVCRSPAASVVSSSAASASSWFTATSTAASASTAARYLSLNTAQQSTLFRCKTIPQVHLARWCSSVLCSGHPKTSAFCIDSFDKGLQTALPTTMTTFVNVLWWFIQDKLDKKQGYVKNDA